MTSHLEKLSRDDLEAKLVKRCWEDETFRQQLLADPAGTIAKHLRVSPAILPKISVHEEATGSWHIAELELVSGGTTLACVTLGVSVATLSVTISAKVTEEAECW
jgi:hypothetical protein